MVKLSVVIPHLNYGRYLRQCLDSIITQTMPPDEIILVDGGSTDNTFRVLERYPKVNVIREPFHSGSIPHAINLGLLKAHGEAINIATSDCYFHPTFFEKCLTILKKTPELGMVYTKRYFVNNQGKILGVQPTPKKFDRQHLITIGNYIDLMTVVFRRKCLAQTGFFEESLAYHFDWMMWLRLSRHYAVAFIDEPLIYFRLHRQQRAQDEEYKIDFELAKVKISREERIPLKITVETRWATLPLYRRFRIATKLVLGDFYNKYLKRLIK